MTTVNASVGGGIWSVFYCYVLTKEYNYKLDIGIFTNCILGGLVSVTAICALCKPWEALLIGIAGGFVVSYGECLTQLCFHPKYLLSDGSQILSSMIYVFSVSGTAFFILGVLLIRKLKIDDPVSCIPVHCFCGIWGMLCVG